MGGKIAVAATAGTSTLSVQENTKSATTTKKYTLSPGRAKHILEGDATGGGHLYPGKTGKSVFPRHWDGLKVKQYITEVANAPETQWNPSTGTLEQNGKRPDSFSNLGKRNDRIVGTGEKEGVLIKVVVEPNIGEIITGFPI